MEEGPLVMDFGNLISVVLTAIPSILVTVLYARRTKKAEVKYKEAEARAKEIENKKGDIGTAKEMIDLVKQANAEAYENQQKINKSLENEMEKLRKTVVQFKNAIKSIRGCKHNNDCPVYAELQGDKSDSRKRE